jgi:uncharacterized protein YegP (UPF0339 family)
METSVTQIQVFKSEKSGEWYWRAVAGNNEIVATSEAYTRKEDAIYSAASVFPGVESVYRSWEDR